MREASTSASRSVEVKSLRSSSDQVCWLDSTVARYDVEIVLTNVSTRDFWVASNSGWRSDAAARSAPKARVNVANRCCPSTISKAGRAYAGRACSTETIAPKK